MGLIKRGFNLVLVGLIFMMTACTSSSPQSDNSTESPDWQATVTAFRDFVRGQNLTDDDIVNDIPDPQGDFDPNELLEYLPHLHLKPGYTLDYVYFEGAISGEPFLYVRRITDPPLDNAWAYLDQSEECEQGANPTACHYWYFIETDGSEEGYFELVLLKMMGGQFYLFWHSCYDDVEIVASEERLIELVNSIGRDDSSIELTETQKREALKIDPTPQITFGPGRVKVRVVWFTHWGGFTETIYTISTHSLTKIIPSFSRALVKYDCGIIY
ncbi:hypothetical protein JR338_10545 [Chloroflexota bacterium]|nr:hypothetical protein JR338_10545 [Chloroflexota bacterium]